MRNLGVLLLLLATPTLSRQSASTVEGVVTRSGTNDPVAGAKVSLQPGRVAGVMEVPFVIGAKQVTTGADGRFQFQGLVAAPYRITVIRDGYLLQDYGQTSPFGVGRPIYVTEKSTHNLSIPLTPMSTLSGRVSDDSGQPAFAVTVKLLRLIHSTLGKRYSEVETTQTDDRGQYRLFGILPGRYYLHAGTPSGFRTNAAPRYMAGFYAFLTTCLKVRQPRRTERFVL
jgi:5-hydroxyisourate hydrolase-like protein (transthyretin family)